MLHKFAITAAHFVFDDENVGKYKEMKQESIKNQPTDMNIKMLPHFLLTLIAKF
jgi:hypothetical protein